MSCIWPVIENFFCSHMTVLPTGPLGRLVKNCAEDAGVNLQHLVEVEKADIGI